MTGKVYLVGAGPGDPDLLTLKAVKALARADVVLCDDLVADAILAHARPGARIVHVGKRGGCRSTPQEFIERLMVAEARQGRTVVRLKGGDPMIFGRGGEECAALRASGIEHEVINGITSGLAAATSAGIPLTHRGLCHGAILVTGHEGRGRATDWAALVRTGLPLVIYMGVARAASLQSALLAAGMAADMPVAVIANATRPEEAALLTRLSTMERVLREAGIASPAIIVAGEVAALASLPVNRSWRARPAGASC
jgi:uroporphyrin-III C-methyltransferase